VKFLANGRYIRSSVVYILIEIHTQTFRVLYQHLHIFFGKWQIYIRSRSEVEVFTLELVEREERIEVRPLPEREAFSDLLPLVRQCADHRPRLAHHHHVDGSRPVGRRSGGGGGMVRRQAVDMVARQTSGAEMDGRRRPGATPEAAGCQQLV
jgi:hypothetical protein